MTDNTTPTKVCTKCRKEYPTTLEYFARNGQYLNSYCKQCKRKKDKHWRDTNPEKAHESAKKYREANSERERERDRRWRKTNPEKRRATRIKRHAQKMRALGTWTSGDIKALFNNQHGKCWYCLKSIEHNYHIEHRIPLSRGGSNELNNIVLACPKCNQSKGTKTPDEWIGRLL